MRARRYPIGDKSGSTTVLVPRVITQCHSTGGVAVALLRAPEGLTDPNRPACEAQWLIAAHRRTGRRRSPMRSPRQ